MLLTFGQETGERKSVIGEHRKNRSNAQALVKHSFSIKRSLQLATKCGNRRPLVLAVLHDIEKRAGLIT